MSRLICTFILLVAVFVSYSQSENFKTVAIKKVTASDIKTIIDTTSGALIVNFWASWCGPCIREIPWFDSIISQTQLPVKLLLVSLDFAAHYPKKLSDFVRKQGYKGEVVFLNELSSKYYISVINKSWTGEIPASIFVNNSRKIYKVFNQQLPPKKFQLELDKLLQ